MPMETVSPIKKAFNFFITMIIILWIISILSNAAIYLFLDVIKEWTVILKNIFGVNWGVIFFAIGGIAVNLITVILGIVISLNRIFNITTIKIEDKATTKKYFKIAIMIAFVISKFEIKYLFSIYFYIVMLVPVVIVALFTFPKVDKKIDEEAV